MFTGIITNLGVVQAIHKNKSESILTIKVDSKKDFKDVTLGESIAINGCCLTVVSRDKNIFSFEVSPETNKITNLGNLEKGSIVNLERAMKLSDRVSGHLVQGHVDSVAKCIRVKKLGKYIELGVEIDSKYSKYFSKKGSICLNGVSLTINKITKTKNKLQLFQMIIPHTWRHTNLQYAKIGSRLNVEVDMIAKVVEGLLQKF